MQLEADRVAMIECCFALFSTDSGPCAINWTKLRHQNDCGPPVAVESTRILPDVFIACALMAYGAGSHFPRDRLALGTPVAT
jgi:hypothetical protein